VSRGATTHFPFGMTSPHVYIRRHSLQAVKASKRHLINWLERYKKFCKFRGKRFASDALSATIVVSLQETSPSILRRALNTRSFTEGHALTEVRPRESFRRRPVCACHYLTPNPSEAARSTLVGIYRVASGTHSYPSPKRSYQSFLQASSRSRR
jgi:hypothetical protein